MENKRERRAREKKGQDEDGEKEDRRKKSHTRRRRGEREKLMTWRERGGTSGEIKIVESSFCAVSLAQRDGILDSPLSDWRIIHLPYSGKRIFRK